MNTDEIIVIEPSSTGWIKSPRWLDPFIRLVCLIIRKVVPATNLHWYRPTWASNDMGKRGYFEYGHTVIITNKDKKFKVEKF